MSLFTFHFARDPCRFFFLLAQLPFAATAVDRRKVCLVRVGSGTNVLHIYAD